MSPCFLHLMLQDFHITNYMSPKGKVCWTGMWFQTQLAKFQFFLTRVDKTGKKVCIINHMKLQITM